METLKTIAANYRKAGLSVLPANVQLKFAALPAWKEYQKRLPNETEINARFSSGQTGLCIVTGAVSGNLEMIDFDQKAELYNAWHERVQSQCPELLDQMVIETSQSGGFHVIYRCQGEVCKSHKLAQRKVPVPSGDEVVIGGKKYKPHKDKDGSWYVILTLIETRGQGGLFLCTPTPGYELVREQRIGGPNQKRVLIESGDHKDKWGTVGVSENIIEATWQALVDSIEYKLLSKN